MTFYVEMAILSKKLRFGNQRCRFGYRNSILAGNFPYYLVVFFDLSLQCVIDGWVVVILRSILGNNVQISSC